MDRAGDQKLNYAIYFGLTTTLVTLIYELMLSYVFKIKTDLPTWTFAKWIISVLSLLLFISIANYFLSLYINNIMGQMSLYFFFKMAFATLAIGVFPLVFFGSLKIVKLRTRNENIASLLILENKQKESEANNRSFQIENGSAVLDLQSDNFLYAQSMQNYVNLFILKNDKIEKEIVRSTLIKIKTSIEGESIIQCHRSFIVNTKFVESVSGNAQGLKLKMKHHEETVPVSRKFISIIRSKLA